MASELYSWKRFWVPWGKTIPIVDDGFLLDPEKEWARFYSHDLVELEAFDSTPVVFLLGEPGSGKSTVLKTEVQRLKDKEAARVLWFDLRNMDSSSWINDTIFQNKTIREWEAKNCTGVLYLLLDSLDESRQDPDRNLSNLMEKIANKGWPLDRLRLRVACRTAVFPRGSFEKSVLLFPEAQNSEEKYPVLQLVSLRREDVVVAARVNGILPDKFLDEVRRLGAETSAANPLFLDLLFQIYKEKKSLPKHKCELLKDGCLLFCENGSEDYTSKQLFIAASKIAIFSLLSGRRDIKASFHVSDKYLSVRTLAYGTEAYEGQMFDITEGLLSAALETGLFSRSETEVFVFSHQSYADFLGAEYLRHRGLSVEQLMNLFFLSSMEAVVPQLRDLIVWMIPSNDELFKILLERDPLLLIESDSLSSSQRETLVCILLRKVDWVKISWEKRDRVRHFYRNLNYPDLDNILRPLIGSSGDDPYRRQVSIDIAGTCRIETLVPELSACLNDKDEFTTIRRDAAIALGRIGTREALMVLRPFLEELPADEDIERKLQYVAFSFLWPDHLSPSDFFECIGRFSDRDLGILGTYFAITDIVSSSWDKKDFLVGLLWMRNYELSRTKKDDGRTPFGYFEKMEDELLLGSIQYLYDSTVRNVFVEALTARFHNQHIIVSDQKKRSSLQRKIAESEVDVQRSILSTLVKSSDDWSTWVIVGSELDLPLPEMLPWILEKCEEAFFESGCGGENYTSRWLDLIWRIADCTDPSHIEMIRDKHVDIPAFADKFRWLSSEDADKTAEEIAEVIRKREQENQEAAFRMCAERSLQERIDRLSKRITENKESIYWTSLLAEIGEIEGLCAFDITETAIWKECDEPQRSTILDTAELFLQRATFPEKTLGSGIYYDYEHAITRAYFLLEVCRPQVLNSFLEDVWQRHLPFLLDGEFGWNNEDDAQNEIIGQIVKKGYEKHPSRFLEIIEVLLRNAERGISHFLADQLSFLWGASIRDLLRGLLDQALNPETFRRLLVLFLDRDDAEAKELVRKILRGETPWNDLTANAERILQAIRVVMRFPSSVDWSDFMTFLNSDDDIAKKVTLDIADHSFERSFFSTELRTPSELGAFYLRVSEIFPPGEDPKWTRHDGQELTARHMVSELRAKVLENIILAGTSEALIVLKEIQKKIPEIPADSITRAQDNLYANSWQPFSPEILRCYFEKTDRRFVHSPEQLLEVLLGSLRRMERILQGETPRVIRLWNEDNENRRDIFWPKSENRLSDEVKFHFEDDLRDRGIIVNREVEIRPTTTSGSGERVDLYVSAVSTESTCAWKTITVVIEIKGSWNKEVQSAMETQLASEYLKDSKAHCGIYLVGFFDCDPKQFKKRDSKKPRWNTLADGKKALELQAKVLTDSEPVVVKSFVLDCCLHNEEV